MFRIVWYSSTNYSWSCSSLNCNESKWIRFNGNRFRGRPIYSICSGCLFNTENIILQISEALVFDKLPAVETFQSPDSCGQSFMMDFATLILWALDPGDCFSATLHDLAVTLGQDLTFTQHVCRKWPVQHSAQFVSHVLGLTTAMPIFYEYERYLKFPPALGPYSVLNATTRLIGGALTVSGRFVPNSKQMLFNCY